jgi:hypothetical protein
MTNVISLHSLRIYYLKIGIEDGDLMLTALQKARENQGDDLLWQDF